MWIDHVVKIAWRAPPPVSMLTVLAVFSSKLRPLHKKYPSANAATWRRPTANARSSPFALRRCLRISRVLGWSNFMHISHKVRFNFQILSIVLLRWWTWTPGLGKRVTIAVEVRLQETVPILQSKLDFLVVSMSRCEFAIDVVGSSTNCSAVVGYDGSWCQVHSDGPNFWVHSPAQHNQKLLFTLICHWLR